jgi:hypothetical protein
VLLLRCLSCPDIVKEAKAANLPEASGWDYDYSDQFGYHAKLTNTIDIDFFMVCVLLA